MPPSLLHPRHFCSFDHPISYNLFFTHPPSTSSFLATFRCLSVHASTVLLRSLAWIGIARFATKTCSLQAFQLLPLPLSHSHTFRPNESVAMERTAQPRERWRDRSMDTRWAVFGSQTTACHDSSLSVSQILTSSTLNHILRRSPGIAV